MAWTGKKFAGVGCGVLLIGAVVAAGTMTWYSSRIAGEYRKVQQSEKALVAATTTVAAYVPPADGVPAPGRLETFAAVRERTAEWRTRLAAENRRFAAGTGNWWRRADEASDLAQTLAGFWLARNEALTAAALGPDEYTWLYGLVYYGWQGHDPEAGRQPGTEMAGGVTTTDRDRADTLRALWKDGVSVGAALHLEALRNRLLAGWTEDTNPVELIFTGDADGDQDTGR